MPALTRERKREFVRELADKLRRARCLVLADFTGLDAQEMNEVRWRLREAGAECRVVRNTLLEKALEMAELELEEQFLGGPTALILGYEDSVALVKAAVDLAREKGPFKLKGGLVEGRVLDSEGLKAIAALPPRDELLRMIVGALAGPLYGFLYVLQAPILELCLLLQTIAEKGEAKGGGSKVTKEEIIEAIKNMTVLELNELVQSLKKEFGIEAIAAPVAATPAAGAAAPAAAEAAPEEEKTEFDVILTSFGDKKIQVIKAVREITGLGLKEAKELVESAPKPIKEGVSKEEAEEIKKKLEEAGATVEIK